MGGEYAGGERTTVHCACGLLTKSKDSALIEPENAVMKKQPKVIPTSEKLPRADQRVVVVCRRSRCLGYRDSQGVWRSHAKKQALEDVVGWYNVGG